MTITASVVDTRSSEVKVINKIANCFLNDEDLKPIYKYFLFRDQCFWATNGHLLFRVKFLYAEGFQEGTYPFDQFLSLDKLEGVGPPKNVEGYPDLPKVFADLKKAANRYLSLLGDLSQEAQAGVEFSLKDKNKVAFFSIGNSYKGILIEGLLMPLQKIL